MEQIWDPLRRKNVTATPEERVRQWFILQLRQSFGVPVTMMNSEVGFLFGGKRYRADIIIYDRSGAPVAVVECKRPDVSITEEVATQAMQYNSAQSEISDTYKRKNDLYLHFERRCFCIV